MSKKAHTCALCSKPLSGADEDSRFTVSDATDGSPTGHWCSVRHYLTSVHGPEAVERVYAEMFVPKELT